MKQIDYVKRELAADIKNANKHLNMLYKEVAIMRELPDDCTGYVFDDGVVCENKEYKHDMLQSYYHQIGYNECLKNNSKNILSVLSYSDEDFDNFIARQKLIEKQNKKTLSIIRNNIKNKLKDNE